jgi:hypothetical protein
MNTGNEATRAQSAALQELGLSEHHIAAFLEGRAAVYYLPTESEPGIAIIQKWGARLRSGIVVINDPGGGVKTLLRFRQRSRTVARTFHLAELELFGAAVINDKLESILLNNGFARDRIVCPDELGNDGNIDILAKVFAV